MPIKGGKLTPQERIFAERMAATGDAKYAAEKAGYGSPSKRASQNLQNPALVADIHRQSLAKLRSEILPLAIDRHMQILADPKVTGQSLNKAIEMAYKYGGVAADPDGNVKDAADMSPQELGAAIAALQRAKAEAQRPTIDLEANKPEPNSVFD